MGVACSTSLDSHEYIAFVVVTLIALKAMPPSEVALQHREVTRLLSHFKEHLDVLSSPQEGEGKGVAWSQLALEDVFVPLVEKHGKKALSLRLLYLWSLEVLSKHLLLPKALSSSE